ncbi:uncharacterized protein LOC134843925 [Symsagittifera roscoffensis]|uniref:uncharacterized protein LOC134843925 n=1 Tax=Symsagittifera roscoffensis TaxID=84072 RepID=UPI00307C72F8
MASDKLELNRSSFTWGNFFKEAGLPPSVCANYAVLFIDNRMKKSMLPDINKEILHELGIRAVGDVIAILRHAKLIYSEIQPLSHSKKKETSSSVMGQQITASKDALKDRPKEESRNNARHKETPRTRKVSSSSYESAYNTRSSDPGKRKNYLQNQESRSQRKKISSTSKTKKISSTSKGNELPRSRKREGKIKVSETETESERYDSSSERDLKRAKNLSKKRKVVLEDIPTEESRVIHKRNRGLLKMNKDVTEKPEPTVSRDIEIITTGDLLGQPSKLRLMSSSRSDEETNDLMNLCRLTYLAGQYHLDKSNDRMLSEAKFGESDIEDSITGLDDLGNHPKKEQTVKLVMSPVATTFVRVISDRRDDMLEEFFPQKTISLSQEVEQNREVRNILARGRQSLDRSRFQTGLDYIGTFRNDYSDEVRPTTLVSDKREEKLINRLGSKSEIKEENKQAGSLTILDESGDRKTTSLSDKDRTVIRLTKYDSVYKRLGPEQKVPIKPTTLGVLGSDSPMSSHKSVSENDVIEKIQNDSRSSDVIYDRRALKRRLPPKSGQTDLRDVLKCKGGFLPSTESGYKGFGSKEASLSADLRDRLAGRAPAFDSDRFGPSRLKNLKFENGGRENRRSDGKCLLSKTMKDVMQSRHSIDDRW